jgi:hypothetical protein
MRYLGGYTGTMSLIDEIEEVLDRKLEEALDRKLDEKLDHKLGALMEYMDGRFDGLAEAVQTTLEIVSNQPSREEFDDLKSEVATIRLAVTATNQDLRKLTHA